MINTSKKLLKIEKNLQNLSQNDLSIVLRFVEFLSSEKLDNSKKKVGLQLNWMGALRQYKGQYSSLELQKLALAWREA